MMSDDGDKSPKVFMVVLTPQQRVRVKKSKITLVYTKIFPWYGDITGFFRNFAFAFSKNENYCISNNSINNKS